VTLPGQRRDATWMLFDAPLTPTPAPPTAGDGLDATLLAWSAQLEGGVKFSRPVGGSALHLRAELPLPEDAASDEDAQSGFGAVEAGFAAAARQLGIDSPHVGVSPPPESEGELPDMASLCAETGWPFDERAEGGVAIDLAVPGLCLPAHVEAREAGIFLQAELTEAPRSPRACREALAALLLGINAAHRMVRGVFRNDLGASGDARAWLEAWLPGNASSSQLGEAIASAAVAARHCALEARCLAGDERLARAFLARSREAGERSK